MNNTTTQKYFFRMGRIKNKYWKNKSITASDQFYSKKVKGDDQYFFNKLIASLKQQKG